MHRQPRPRFSLLAHKLYIWRLYTSAKSRSDVNGEERESRNYGRYTKFVRTATDQDARDVQDKSVVANAPEVSFSTTITGAS